MSILEDAEMFLKRNEWHGVPEGIEKLPPIAEALVEAAGLVRSLECTTDHTGLMEDARAFLKRVGWSDEAIERKFIG